MADVTDVFPRVQAGDAAVILGEYGDNTSVCAEELAAAIGSIGYEILCGVGKRVPRVYVK
jgi:alanine racemase